MGLRVVVEPFFSLSVWNTKEGGSEGMVMMW